MSNAMYFDAVVALGGTMAYPTARGPINVNHLVMLSRQSLPTDPVGTHTLTLTNVVVGSRVVVRDQAKTTVKYNEIAAASTVVITLAVYAAGSPLNNWLIDIRQGHTAPYYQRYKTLMTAAAGSSSIYVNQLPDQR